MNIPRLDLKQAVLGVGIIATIVLVAMSAGNTDEPQRQADTTRAGESAPHHTAPAFTPTPEPTALPSPEDIKPIFEPDEAHAAHEMAREFVVLATSYSHDDDRARRRNRLVDASDQSPWVTTVGPDRQAWTACEQAQCNVVASADLVRDSVWSQPAAADAPTLLSTLVDVQVRATFDGKTSETTVRYEVTLTKRNDGWVVSGLAEL